jgi:Xaa-Pro aminopeptidase
VLKVEREVEVLKVIKESLKEKGVKKLGFEDKTMNLRFYKDISEKYEFLKLSKGSNLIDKLRQVKTQGEIEKIREACRIADIGIKVAISNIEPGRTELDVAIEAEYAMRKAGSSGVSFDTIVASGYRSALPHAVSSDKKISKGDFVIIDLGGTFKGYCSDMTRTVVCGEPTQKQMKIFNAVLEAQQKAIRNCKLEMEAAELDQIARESFTKQGFEEFFVHALGHGVGLEVHELPYIGLKSKDKFAAGNVFTIEPGIYIPNFGGVRIEDVVVQKENDVERLTKSEYEIAG